MKFTIIDVEKHEVRTVSFDGIDRAMADAKLKSGHVDHGVVAPGLGIVVYEFGLFAKTSEQRYFSMAGRLYAGNAVLYGFDYAGESVDVVGDTPVINWLDTEEDVELAIVAGVVDRPRIAMNGEVVWQWPQPQQGQP